MKYLKRFTSCRFVQKPPRWVSVLSWVIALAIFGFFSCKVAKIGMDARRDFWSYWQGNHFYGDPESALYNGRFVLRQCKALESADSENAHDDSDSNPTIADPGAGLFDYPRTPAIVWHRWQRLKPIYAHLFRGWVAAYNNLVRDQTDGDYVMDYPPLRSLMMTLWAWKVEAEFPDINNFPRQAEWAFNPHTQQRELLSPDIIWPLVMCNIMADAFSAVAMFCLVFIWVRRGNAAHAPGLATPPGWGDPLLLIAPTATALYLAARPYVSLLCSGLTLGSSLLDVRVTSFGWWIFLLLRYLSVVALARFLPGNFRALACGIVAGTFVWLNPASMLDSIGWPQWEVWLLPFFLIAAVLVSLDWWLTAGVVLAVGGMFKGQLYFVAPVLALAPLFAGWFGRFSRMIVGLALGAGLMIWPWLVTNSRAEAFICGCVFAAAVVCAISVFRWPLLIEIRRLVPWLQERIAGRRKTATSTESQPQPKPRARSAIRWPMWTALAVALITAAVLPLLIWREQDPAQHGYLLTLTFAILLVPWFLRRRSLAAWMTAVFAAALWLAGFSLNGSFSWWIVGFKYGTVKHQNMQLGGQSLSNLSSLLEVRYGWSLHDPVGTLTLPGMSPVDLDLQSFLALVFGIALLLCSIAAGVHLRRRDPKFLIAIVAPWLLFVGLLTQMAARYTIFPAVLGTVFIGYSVSFSLLEVLLVVMSFTMLGNQLLNSDPSIAPAMFSITRSTYPDMGWLTVCLVMVLLVAALSPSRRGTRRQVSPHANNPVSASALQAELNL